MVVALLKIKTWEELTICDNFLFQKVMRNQRICKQLIEKILHIRITEISFPETEKSIDVNYDSKSVRLDVYVHDEQGRIYDIEMQCTSGTDSELPKRTGYYQGMIDMDETEKGQYYQDLKESFIIFICTFDPFDQGRPMYTFRNLCIEDKTLELGDQATKIFLNSKGKSDTLDPDIAAFLRYVDGKAAEGTFTKEVNQEVIRVKKHEETRREYMTYARELQQWKRQCLAEGRAEGRAEGVEGEKRETILSLVKIQMPKEMIAQVTRSSIPYVEEVIRSAGGSVS